MDDDRRKDHNKGAVKHGTPDDDGSLNRRMFALRLVTLDYYLAAPSAPLDPLVSKLGGWEVWQVPVLRIFGVTPAGQKACLHVHGALPYLTVPCSESRPERFAVVLASEIDLLLNTAAGRATSMHRHVHHVAVFRGTRLYGFHDREETFLRIYLYNPLHVPKVAELLLSGHVLKQTMQPHEAHIPYALQFMVDHNLHGMSFVRVELFKFRRPLSWAHDDRSRALGSGPGIWSLRNLPVELFGDLEKQTTCELELDCCAKDILNANEKDVLSPGLAALWQEEEDRRQEPVSWEPLSLEEDSFPPTESEQFYLARLDKLLSRPVMEEQDQTGFGKQPRKKHQSSLLDTSHGILDSQDEALAEALAQAASSWQRSGVEEEDSILGSLPTPDNGVDDEDDNDVEDMTQVFQLAGEGEQDDADSSMSDHSDGNEAYDPFQLDGADDQPDCAVGVSKTAATTTRDQGTQTGARPPVLVRQLLGRARARRFTRLSLRRQQQQHSQMRKQERSPVKRTGAEGPHRSGEAPGSSPPVAEDWQRWQSCCVASMLMAPGEGGSTPSGGEPNQSPSLSIRSHESSAHLLDAVRPCSIRLSRLSEQEIIRWQHQQEPKGRRRWSLRDLNKPGHSGAAPDVSEPKRQRRKRGLSAGSSASSQQSASAGARRAAPVNSVLPHSEQFTNVEARSVEPAHRTRRVSYSSASEDGQVLHRHAKAKTDKASKRLKVAAEFSSSDRTLRRREVGEKADKDRRAEAVADAGGDAGSLDFCAAVATADLSAELRVPSVRERVPHSRREKKLSSKRQLAVEVIESVPDSGASSSSSSSQLVNRSSDTDASVSRPSIICRIRIQGNHGVISTTSTRPRVVGFVSPDKSITESRVADLGSPPTLSASELSSSTLVGAQMSDEPVPAATPLSSEVTNLSDSLKIKVSKRNKSSSATPEATETLLRSPDKVHTSTEFLATHLSPEVVDPVEVSKRKVSKKSRSNIVIPEAAVVQLENSEAVHASDASSLATPSNSEVLNSGVALRRPKRSRKGQASSGTPEEPVVQPESTKDVCVVDSLESAATPSTSKLEGSVATLRTKLSNKSKSSDMAPEAPAVQLENSPLAPVSDASATLATHLSSELVDSGIVPRHPRKSKSNTVAPGAPAVDIERVEASCASDTATALAASLSTELVDSDEVELPESSWKSKLRTAASDTCDGHLEIREAGNVSNTHESEPTTLSSEVTDHGASLRVKFSRRSSSSRAKPKTPADQPKSSEAAHMSNAPNPVAITFRSDTEDSAVLSRPKRSRKSKYGTVAPEAAGTHLESSQVGHVPDTVTPFSAFSSAEGANTGTVSKSKSSRKSKSSIATPETLLESSQANATPDVATSLAIPMSSEVADSSVKLRPRSSRKTKLNVVTPETPETHLESFKPMLSDAPPMAAELKVSEAATCGLPSRRNTRSASDVGPSRTRLASTCSSGKPAGFPEPACSGPASIGNTYDHQLVSVMGAQDAILGTSQPSSDVDAIQEPENVSLVSRPARRKRIVSLCSSSDSQDATNIPSDESTARPGNEVRATTRCTRRQAASTKLSLRHVGATRSSSAESVTSTSSFEVSSGGLTEMSLTKQEILSKQASGVEEKSNSKVPVRRSRSRGNSASASLSCSTESTNAAELGSTSAVQGGAQTVKPKEVRSRSSPRISANKLALRRKVREEDNEGGASELQNNNCLVADTSDNSPALDVGVVSKATTGVATSNVSPFDNASCSTGASFANLVSNRTTTGLVSSGLQMTSSSMHNEEIPKPGVPEAVGPQEHPGLGAPRLGTPSGKRGVGGLPIRSSKSRKKVVLPEAPDPQIQELLVTCERLTITTPGELSVDDSVGSKQPDVAQPSTSFNLPEAAGCVDPPQKFSPSSGSDSVQNESHQRYESNREPEAEHLKGPSNSSSIVDTRASGILKSGVSSSTGGAADAGDLTKGAPNRVENRPDLILEPALVPSCALSESGTTDSDTQSSHLNTAGEGFVVARESETSLLHPKQRPCDVTDSDALPARSHIPLSDVTMIEPNIELEAPEEVNVCSAVSCDLVAVNASTNASLDAGRNGPTPVESVQEDSSVISIGNVELSELTAKPGVPDMAHTNTPADELLSSDSNKLPTNSHSSPFSTSSIARREPLTSPVGNRFDSSGSSPIGTAVEHCEPRVTSDIEQSSSLTLDGRQVVSECPADDLVTELNRPIESGQKATEDCTEKATDLVGTPESVSIPCGQEEHNPSTASSDDVQVVAESSSCICADNEQAAASQERAVDTNSAEVSSADDDDDFLCLSADGDDEWILLDEVSDDSVELFPSPKGSIAADTDESCGDDTVVENIASAPDVNLVHIGVCKKATTADNIGDVGGTVKDAVGHLNGASSEKGVCYEGSSSDFVENSGRESRSKKSVASVFRESSTGNTSEPNCGSHDENVNSIDGVTGVAGDECVVNRDGESCPEPASSMENFEISNETLASNSCDEVLRNFGSDSSMIDVGSENFLDPVDNDECKEKMAKGDCANITSADVVQDFGSENCVGDIGSEGAEFIASENFIEDIGSEENLEVFSGTDSESKQHKKEAVVGEISSDSRQHEDTCAMVAAAKSVQVVVERLDDIDPCSAIGMLYCKAKNALKYNRAPCKVVEIAKNKHEGKPDNAQAGQAGTEKKGRTVGRPTARKSPVSHRQTLGPSKSLRAPSSQTAPKDLQVLHQSPREQDSIDQLVSAEKAPSSIRKTFKSSKTSHKGLLASGNQVSLSDSQAKHAKVEEQDGSVAPFSGDKSSSVKQASKSSKSLRKDHRDAHCQHFVKSADESKAKPTVPKKKDGSGSRLSVDKSSNGHQIASKASKSSSQDVKVAKNKDSDTTNRKPEALRPVVKKQVVGAAHSSLERSLNRDQEALKSSKTSHRAFNVNVAKKKDSAASASKADAQQPNTEKLADTVNCSSVGESPSHDQKASKSSKTSHRSFKVVKNKDSVASLGKAQAQQLSTKKQSDSADHSSVQELPCHDQVTTKSSKTSDRAFKVTKNKGNHASARKAEARQLGIDKQGDTVDSSVGESPSHDQEALISCKTSHQALKVAKNKDSVATLGKAQAQQPSTEKQSDSADHSSVQELPCHDQAVSKSSETSHRAFKVTKNKGSAASESKAEALQPNTEKLADTVDCSLVVESPSHDQKASKSSKTTHKTFKAAKDKDSATSPCKAQAQQLSTERQGDSADHSPAQEFPCRVQVTSKSSKISCHDVNFDKTKDSCASPNKAEAQQAVMEEQVNSVDPFLFDRSQSHDQESLKSSKTFCQDFEFAENKGSHTSPNKTEAHQEVTEKQGDNVDPFSLEKSSSLDQQVSRSSGNLNKDITTYGSEVPVCVNGELGPDNLEDQKAGGDVQQQDECVEPLQIARSETLPPTDMGKVPGLLDQVLDLGELPDAIKCLLDSEVPLPELDADCFSLPPDSTRWLSEDGVVEKRKPDERPQNSKEDSTSFCPSSDIELGDFKACSLTNEGLVALVPAVPPPTCGPHFNSSSTPRVRKKCLRGLAHWQKTKLEAFARDSCFEVDFEHNPELRIAFCRDRSVVLTPARSAPTVSLLAPTLQRPPPSPDDDVASIRELPASDASTDPAMLLVSPPSTPPRHETSTSQLDGPTGRFALSGARLPADTERVLTVLSVEVHVRTRSDLRPDPDYDPVQCVLWCARGYGVDAPLEAGAMHWCSVGDPRQVDIEDLVGTSLHRTGVATTSLRTQVVRSELDLLHAVVDLVHRWDPDVLLGYDVERASWGYLCDRAERLDLDLYARLSRAPPPPGRKDILGRILLCAWRILRKEVALNIYTFENTYFHVMHRRVPLYSFRLLSEWFSKDLFRWRTVEHYALRARGNLELLDELNVFGKTSQMARIFGIQFYEVLSRGSQFRVESMLLRLARSHRMVALSASTAQRARQRAPEFIPLVLEPRAQLYTDPVVVLDFQSLYPSVIISHNYCFSTCLGRVENLGSSAPFGCSSLEVPLQYVKSLRDHITVSPAGVAFVKPSIRRGLLPQMLDEVLGTRIMVKKAMSQCANKGLYRVLDAQQLSLKLIANVTYGYTAAGFSGRMPCVEVADSVVSKGREALELAIRTAEATVPGARVVYGDTDSLFVLLEGRSREEAFRLGQEIADRVTAQNPRPMRLKLEKVYQPCLLQTKKRYVGFSYESPDQQEPKYDAKGIETVRRDSCPAVAKLLEKMLRVLFTSRDMVPVKRFVKLQFSKILAERVSPQDFIFAREFRGLHGYQPSACVPALEIARRQLRRDPRAEPLVGERVPYVVVYGHPGQRLIELVRSPLELLSGQLRINAHYYVARVIGPALNRVLRLLGADCLQWYEELPRPRFVSTPRPGTMAAYVVVNQLCLACGGQAESRQLCASCEADPAYAALILGGKVQRVQKALLELQTVCHSCMGFQAGSVCLSVDCPVLFKTSRVTTEAQQALEWNRARNSVPASSS